MASQAAPLVATEAPFASEASPASAAPEASTASTNTQATGAPRVRLLLEERLEKSALFDPVLDRLLIQQAGGPNLNDVSSDLPKRPASHDIAEGAKAVFFQAIAACAFFVPQTQESDYGTDVQLEARDGDAMTNLRVCVQLKGTKADTNADGSISVPVARENLNYLLAQPNSLYVCYHEPTSRLLARFAVDVYHEYERGRAHWATQTPDHRQIRRPLQ